MEIKYDQSNEINTINNFKMSKKLKKFKVEELEQRFETGRWISEVKTGIIYQHDDKWRLEANVSWEV